MHVQPCAVGLAAAHSNTLCGSPRAPLQHSGLQGLMSSGYRSGLPRANIPASLCSPIALIHRTVHPDYGGQQWPLLAPSQVHSSRPPTPGRNLQAVPAAHLKKTGYFPGRESLGASRSNSIVPHDYAPLNSGMATPPQFGRLPLQQPVHKGRPCSRGRSSSPHQARRSPPVVIPAAATASIAPKQGGSPQVPSAPPQVLQRIHAVPPPAAAQHSQTEVAQCLSSVAMQMHHQATTQAPRALLLDFLEDGGKVEPWLAPDAQKARRIRLCLEQGRTASFIAAQEFISLGCFCGVARALQCIGLKKLTYPFDWVRVPLEGVIHCIHNRFEDFLTYTAVTQPSTVKQPVFVSTRWGGSFWHHNPSLETSARDFSRRAGRFFGKRDVSEENPRIFVRAVNTTREVEHQMEHLECLQRALPHCQVRLLVLVDLQTASGPRRVESCSADALLVYCLREDIFDGTPTCPGSSWTMEKNAEAYAEAIAFACRFWAGDEGREDVIPVHAGFGELSASLVQWDGGCPANELFFPRRFFGAKLTLDGADEEENPRIGTAAELAKATSTNPADLIEASSTRCPSDVQCRTHGEVKDMASPGSSNAASPISAVSQESWRKRPDIVRTVTPRCPIRPVIDDRTETALMLSPRCQAKSVLEEPLEPAPHGPVQSDTQLRLGIPDKIESEKEHVYLSTDLEPYSYVKTEAFGSTIRILVPDGACAGDCLHLMRDGFGAVSCEKVPAPLLRV